MEQILRWLAGIGSDPLPPGENLRFEFLAIPKGGLGFALLCGFLAVTAGIYLIYRRDARRLTFRRRGLLAALRFGALLAVVLVLLEPSLVKVRKVVRPGEVLLLVDTSQSMSHRDSYVRSPEWAEGWKAVGIADPSALPRIDLARRLLAEDGLLAELARKNRVRAYVFGGGIRPAPEITPEGEDPAREPSLRTLQLPPPPVLDLERFEAEEGSTNLTASLRQALEGSQKTRVAAVLLISDGRRNSGGSPEEAGAHLRRRKVEKLLVVPVGDPAETWTTALREVQVPERVFQADPIQVSAIVMSQGYGAQTLTVRLSEVTADGKRVHDLHSTTVEVGGEQSSAEAKFPPVKLDKEGEHFLRVRLEPPLGEPAEDRHEKTQRVEVLSERLRVLVVAGSPSHEYRILRNQLMRDNTIDLSCWLQSADSDFPQDGNTSIKELPKSAKELDAFDVLVMMDPDPVLLDAGFIHMVAEAVSDRGTGLWWVMGEKFSLGAVRPGSPLRPLIDLLPVEPDISTAEHTQGLGKYYKVAHRWSLMPDGKDHRVTRLVTDPVVNEMLWSKLPGFFWAFPVLQPKPAAQVLLKPARRTGAQSENWPVLALQFVGAGRVIYAGTDETYRWRSVAEHAYNEHWVKGLRWLYEGKLTGGSTRYRLGVSTENLTLGQELEIFLRVLDETFQPLAAEKVKVRIVNADGQEQELELKRSPVGEGRFQGEFRPNSIGAWTVQAMAENGGGSDAVGRPVRFEVVRSELESRGPMGLAELTRLVGSGPEGELVRPQELRGRVEDSVASASTEETFTLPYALWDTWLTLGIVLLLLTIEWILRKRFDLL